MTAGAKIVFSLLDGDKTVNSAEKLMRELIKSDSKDMIAFSCAARAWALGAKYYMEAQKIAEIAKEYEQKNNKPYNYCVSYSGGEICPVWDNEGKMVNTLHNYTIITCTFN
jgi:acyl CoA:acetate/3-ketoacid CoA transferase alpha subunit